MSDDRNIHDEITPERRTTMQTDYYKVMKERDEYRTENARLLEENNEALCRYDTLFDEAEQIRIKRDELQAVVDFVAVYQQTREHYDRDRLFFALKAYQAKGQP